VRVQRCSAERARAIMTTSAPGDDTRHIQDGDECWRLDDDASLALNLSGCLPGHAYLAWYGVARTAAGRGLGRRLLATAIKWARGEGLRSIVTYTLSANRNSNRALLKAGFEPYAPDAAWAGWEGVTYWRLELCR